MVNEGLVKLRDKKGNDISDNAVDKGAELTDVVSAALGYVYARRHNQCEAFMRRI